MKSLSLNLDADSAAPGAAQEPRLGREDLSFRDIFIGYNSTVYSFFAKRGVPPEECQDLTQETFLRVYRSMGSIRQVGAVSSFVFTTATNVFRNWIRDRKKHKREGHEVPLDNTFENSPDPSGWIDKVPDSLRGILHATEVEQLRSALDELPPQMRRCVELRLYQEQRYREIAVILGISIETVKAHLHYAKQQLRVRLGDYFGQLDFEDPGARRKP